MADPLLQPLTLRTMTLKNRIVSTAHASHGYNSDDHPGERYMAYFEEKAKGGAGLVMFGGSSFVSPDSHSHFGALDASRDRIVSAYRELADRLHRHGAKTIVQLTHIGRRGDDRAGAWLPTIGPSPIRERAHRSFPKEIEDFDFARVLADYGRAAARAQAGGLDGVEIAALGGHLTDQFLSARANRRTDEYGGPIENRARFLLDVLHAVRAEVSEDFIVGVRMTGDEANPGLGPEDCVEAARLLSASGQVDYFSVVWGGGFTHRELGEQIPGVGSELGGHLSTAGRIRAAVPEPVLHAGRIGDLATARHALREGLVDLVGMTRAHIADPHIVRKLMAGQEERIRPCVGASHCLSGNESLCVHNPATSRETFIPQLITPASGYLKVVVVGGGVAGLEAARVSAERGHDVVLFEAAAQVGGQALLMSRPRRQSEKRSIVAWLEAEARLAKADIRTHAYVEAEDVRRLQPDVVIVATGGIPDVDLPGGGGHLTLSSSDVLSVAPPSGKRILLYDDHGGEQALVVAEHLLAGAENQIEFVTVDEAVGHDVGHTIIPTYKKILYSGGVELTPDHELLSVSGTPGNLNAELRNTMSDALAHRAIDMVVVEQGMHAVHDVYEALRPDSTNGGQLDYSAFAVGHEQQLVVNPAGPYRLFRIGDAVSHRGIHPALYDARRLCMNL